MSFFFDVWTADGFILASDVILLVDEEQQFMRKILPSSHNSTVNCAIAVCGNYPDNCLGYFLKATMQKDSLREVAESFAQEWTDRYAGTEEYSAVHIVGYEKIAVTNVLVPQMWYWNNWSPKQQFLPEDELRRALDSFADPIPSNNHIPQKIKQLAGSFPGSTLQEEHDLVRSFLHQVQPYFTWNGDTMFWRNAAENVNSALRLLRSQKQHWTLEESIELTDACLQFLVKVGMLLPRTTVSLDPQGSFDLLQVTPAGACWVRKSDLPAES